MKIRVDFVSNSSSSSFMMIGVWDDEDSLKKFIEKTYPEWLKKYPNGDISDCDVDELIEDNFGDLTVLHEIGDYTTGICLGLQYSDMRKDETKREFEERIKKALSDFYKKPIDNVRICESSGMC